MCFDPFSCENSKISISRNIVDKDFVRDKHSQNSKSVHFRENLSIFIGISNHKLESQVKFQGRLTQ